MNRVAIRQQIENWFNNLEPEARLELLEEKARLLILRRERLISLRNTRDLTPAENQSLTHTNIELEFLLERLNL